MGGGAWTTSAYTSYMSTTKCINDVSTLNSRSVNQFYTSHKLDEALNPKGVMRECCDSDEHPCTIPVILALDVTGSMGSACAAAARQLDKIMTSLYEKVQDVEFCVMGIGDLAYDSAPIQASQFESDVRILDQLGKIYFERGGGGNMYESYTAAWYFGLHNTKLDCWARGQKGIIITMGDEPLNPYLPGSALARTLGCGAQDVNTKDLYEQVTEKFDVYHIMITDPESCGRDYLEHNKRTWGEYLDGQHLFEGNSNDLPKIITDIVASRETTIITDNDTNTTITDEGIAW